ncbi:MAG: hypothetical protein IPH12_08125 [Saprospirales bacterium]|jgi:hypothetical protein|nr:hypothetical protein [Saprospirales bacterium]MBK8920796.1 hypothetical protein [Saprospirales bacterium]
MKPIFLFCAVLAFIAAACKQDSKPAGGTDTAGGSAYANPTVLAGHWIAIDFCSRANQYGSVLAAMNNAHLPYAYALSFDPNLPDSVICTNGFEKWTLPVRYNRDTMELVGASQGKSVFLLYSSQDNKEITMFDATGESVKMDRFIKSKAESPTGRIAFTVALNHNLFNGTFRQAGKGGSKGAILFNTAGHIRNWGPYDRYEVCTGGDCFVSGNAIDVMALSKSNTEGSERLFGFRYSAGNDTLTLYNLVNQNPAEKGSFVVKGVAYKFLRTPAEN